MFVRACMFAYKVAPVDVTSAPIFVRVLVCSYVSIYVFKPKFVKVFVQVCVTTMFVKAHI